jgi:DNA mismatch endonuclease (patch repair protein)
MDMYSKAVRSYTMSRIRSYKTQPELQMQKLLRSMHFIYQPKNIYGKPDFANRAAKIAIFIDGCFWHGCKKHYNTPRTNVAYWSAKINRNRKRDKLVNMTLKSKGWRIIRIWEHDIPRPRN